MRVKTSVKKPSGSGIALPSMTELAALAGANMCIHWYRKLSQQQRDYVDEVILYIKEHDDVTVLGMSRKLKEVLGLTASVKSIRLYIAEKVSER